MKKDDIVKIKGEQNSWRIVEINGDTFTAFECSENGMNGKIDSFNKDQIEKVFDNEFTIFNLM